METFSSKRLNNINLFQISKLYCSCVQDTTDLAEGYIINQEATGLGTVCTSTKPFQVCFKTDDVEGALGAQSEGMSQFK